MSIPFEYEDGAKVNLKTEAVPNENKYRDKDANDVANYISVTRQNAEDAQTTANNAQSIANDNASSKSDKTDTGLSTSLITIDNSTIVAGVNEVKTQANENETNIEKNRNILSKGSDAYAHAERGVTDGFEVSRIIPLDGFIEDNLRKKIAFSPFGKGLGKVSVPIPNTTATDYYFAGGGGDYIDKYGVTQTAAINEPKFDWSEKFPVLLLDGGICGNSQQVYNPNSLVWKLNIYALVKDQGAAVNEATINDNTSSNRIAAIFRLDSGFQFSVIKGGVFQLSSLNYVSDTTNLNEYAIKSDSGNIAIKYNGILVAVENGIDMPVSLLNKDYHSGAVTVPFEAKIKSDIVSDDLTDFNSTVTSINDILINSKLTIR